MASTDEDVTYVKLGSKNVDDKSKLSNDCESPSDSMNDYGTVQKPDFKALSFPKKILFLMTHITVEPLVFAVAFNSSLLQMITPTFIQFKICRSSLGHEEGICNEIESNETLADEAQDLATNLNMIKMICEAIPSAIILMFIGSWSDRFGRKIPMCLPSIGLGLASLILLILAYWVKETPPETVLIASIFMCFTGGFSGILVSTASYLTDITSPDKRTVRMSIMQGLFMLATPLSSFVGGVVLKNYGYMVIFIIPIIVSCIAILYVIIRLSETVMVSEENKSKSRILAFIDIKNLKDCYHTCVKPRENSDRLYLLLIFIITFLTMVIINGEANMYFWYVQKKFELSRLEYTQFVTTLMASATLGMLCIPLMTTVFKFSNATLGIIAFVNRILKGLAFGLSTKGWMMFASCIFVLLSDLINPVSRAILSHLVTSEELGKVFSIMGACEVITLVFASIIYTNIYNATRETVPGAMFFLTSALSVLSLALFCIIVKDSLVCKNGRKKKFKVIQPKA